MQYVICGGFINISAMCASIPQQSVSNYQVEKRVLLTPNTSKALFNYYISRFSSNLDPPALVIQNWSTPPPKFAHVMLEQKVHVNAYSNRGPFEIMY